MQYYLHYIASFIPTVMDVTPDGSFGPATRDSVISFQKTYGLEENGIVDRVVWDEIENVYYSFLRSIPYNISENNPLPFPGRILRIGIEGNDVAALQEYLNLISDSYPSIPRSAVDGIYGNETAAQVRAFVTEFGIPTSNPERVSASVWNAIISVYDDLYNGNKVQSGQYPGYSVSEA